MTSQNVRTTLALPAELLERIDRAVREGKARSRNALVANALQHELAAMDDAAIDADLLRMADDAEYRVGALELADEIGHEEWRAFQATEAKP